MRQMGDLIGGWRLECGCVHNLLTIEAGSHESRLCSLHETASKLLEALEAVGACIHDHQVEPSVVWVDSESIAMLTPIIRAAIAQAKGE